MNILLIGSGAREHAILKALQQSPQQPKLFCCAVSHHPGIAGLTHARWVGDIGDVQTVVAQAVLWQIDLAIIGPEAPLEKGMADALWAVNIPTIGPTKALAQIETSKSFARDLLKKHHIPGSPRYRCFSDISGVKAFLSELGENQYVIKANGLMGGKGVKVGGDHLHSLTEAYQFCETLQAQHLSFVIEEKCVGEEFSLMCFCDGRTLVPMPLVQDHKRALVGDTGPNTGGMGSYSDANHSLPFLTTKEVSAALAINVAAINALQTECDEKYIGILYGSYMATREGVRLIEFNARFGDPEVMNVLAVLQTDFLEICQAMTTGTLSECAIHFANQATVCKYAVPEGYPDAPLNAQRLDISNMTHDDHFYLGAVDERDGTLYATGSRTAAAVGVGDTICMAEKQAEEQISQVKGSFYHRDDIGKWELIQKRIAWMQTIREKEVV